MEHGKIKVEIAEDYPGAQWYDITIELPGYGGGNRSKFKLIPLDMVLGAEDIIESPFFRPECAKAIKRGLESA
jgi:hypothetical protein